MVDFTPCRVWVSTAAVSSFLGLLNGIYPQRSLQWSLQALVQAHGRKCVAVTYSPARFVFALNQVARVRVSFSSRKGSLQTALNLSEVCPTLRPAEIPATHILQHRKKALPGPVPTSIGTPFQQQTDQRWDIVRTIRTRSQRCWR